MASTSKFFIHKNKANKKRQQKKSHLKYLFIHRQKGKRERKNLSKACHYKCIKWREDTQQRQLRMKFIETSSTAISSE